MKKLSIVEITVPMSVSGIKILNWYDYRKYHDKNSSYYIRKNGANHIIVSDTIIEKSWRDRYGNYLKNRYGPCMIAKYHSSEPHQQSEIKLRWLHSRYFLSISDIEKDEWLCSRNIVLSEKNNFEIPDEHKTEFKLRFV